MLKESDNLHRRYRGHGEFGFSDLFAGNRYDLADVSDSNCEHDEVSHHAVWQIVASFLGTGVP